MGTRRLVLVTGLAFLVEALVLVWFPVFGVRPRLLPPPRLPGLLLPFRVRPLPRLLCPPRLRMPPYRARPLPRLLLRMPPLRSRLLPPLLPPPRRHRQRSPCSMNSSAMPWGTITISTA